MKSISVFILFCFSLAGFSQANTNILPDGGFEAYTGTCYVGPQENIDSTVYWRNGNEGSADYFGTCYNQTNGWVHFYPNLAAGYQYPRTGDAFAGLAATVYPSRNANFREYLRTPLLISLEVGKKYYAGCYVSLGENAKRYAVNNFGIAFSTDTLAPDTSVECCLGELGHPIVFNAQVMNDTTFNLNDTLAWVLVADTFIAQGGEQWLTIGNFRDGTHSIIVPTNYNCDVNDSSSYYFVDDVFLYCVDTACAPIPPMAYFQAGFPLCSNENIQLHDLSGGSPDSWEWYLPGSLTPTSNQQNPIVTYPDSGSYTIILIAHKSNGTSDTLQQILSVNPLPAVSISTPNNTVCAGWHTQLIAAGADTWVWSMGGAGINNRTVSPTVTTSYSVAGTNTLTGCSNMDSITITVVTGPTFNVAVDTLCNTQTAITLNAQPPSGTYSGAGVSGNQFNPQVTGNGTYQLVYSYTNVSLPNCIGTDTAYITVENCSIGMQEYDINIHFLLYPNPAANELHITLNEVQEKERVSIEICNMDGMVLQASFIEAHKQETVLSVAQLPNGVYICKLIKNGVVLTNERLVIMK